MVTFIPWKLDPSGGVYCCPIILAGVRSTFVMSDNLIHFQFSRFIFINFYSCDLMFIAWICHLPSAHMPKVPRLPVNFQGLHDMPKVPRLPVETRGAVFCRPCQSTWHGPWLAPHSDPKKCTARWRETQTNVSLGLFAQFGVPNSVFASSCLKMSVSLRRGAIVSKSGRLFAQMELTFLPPSGGPWGHGLQKVK